MNDNLYREYYQWHHTFLQWYRASQSQPALLGKLEASHPTASKAKRQESTQSFFDDRIHYYNRKEKLDNQTYRYEYSPGLDDLYAVCKAHNLLPNEVLLTAQMGHRNRDLYHLLRYTPSEYLLFTALKINAKDFQIYGDLPQNPDFLRFFQNQVLQHFGDTFQFSRPTVTDPSHVICTFILSSDDPSTNEWLKIACKVIRKRLHSQILNHVDLYSDELSSAPMIGLQFIYDYQDKTFDGFNYSRYRKWSGKKQFLAAFSSFLLVCSVNAVRAMNTLTRDKYTHHHIEKYFIDFFDKNPSVFNFMSNLRIHSFVVISENTVIDACGNLYDEDSLLKAEPTDYDHFQTRNDIDDDDKTGVSQILSATHVKRIF